MQSVLRRNDAPAGERRMKTFYIRRIFLAGWCDNPSAQCLLELVTMRKSIKKSAHLPNLRCRKFRGRERLASCYHPKFTRTSRCGPCRVRAGNDPPIPYLCNGRNRRSLRLSCASAQIALGARLRDHVRQGRAYPFSANGNLWKAAGTAYSFSSSPLYNRGCSIVCFIIPGSRNLSTIFH